jgi:UDP-N-acetylglucosamine 1-carboxyvinyltransferase
MAKFKISGGTPLNGEIIVAGNKNAALPILAATILTDEECLIENVPEIKDVHSMMALLEDLGKKVEKINHHYYRITGTITHSHPNDELTSSLRASILLMSGLLARIGEVTIIPPGGCTIGRRKVDSHLDVLEYFGCNKNLVEKYYQIQLVKSHPADIFLREASVTATENALLLGATITGTSTINNAACEPHVTDLTVVLEKMGAKIEGKGTNRLSVTGLKGLHGFSHRIMPDYIEAGTFAIVAACTKGTLTIHDAERQNLIMTAYHLENLNVKLNFITDNILTIEPSPLISKVKKIQTGLWPGFPTDLMSPMIVLATQAQGTTLCHDWMYESRMFFVDKLIMMGAEITQCDPHRVLVTGPTRLRAQDLSSPDIRAGIALVIAAVTARGTSIIDRVELIDRGYENIEQRLNNVGARIQRLK